MRCWHKLGREVTDHVTKPTYQSEWGAGTCQGERLSRDQTKLTNQNEMLAWVREGGDHVTKQTYQSRWDAGTSREWRWSRDSQGSPQPPPLGQFSVSRLAAAAWISEKVISFFRWVKNLGLASWGGGGRVILPGVQLKIANLAMMASMWYA
jgi:hypothetical protein